MIIFEYIIVTALIAIALGMLSWALSKVGR
jgi:hypothetical protein